MSLNKNTLPEGLAELIFDRAPIGIYTINQDGFIDSVNPKFLDINGAKSVEDITKLNVFTISSYKESGLDAFVRKGLSGEPFETEVPFLSTAGKKRTWRRYRGVPIFGGGGKTVTKLLLLVEDITEQKRLEAELNEYTKGLEEKVAERTRSLEESNKKVEEANELLRKKLVQLERMNKAMVGRELRMIELKKEIINLEKKLGLPANITGNAETEAARQ